MENYRACKFKIVDHLKENGVAIVNGDDENEKIYKEFKKKVATLTRAQAEEIAKTKMPDLNAASLEAATEMIKGTARSMGIVIED